MNSASNIFELICFADDSTLTTSLCLRINNHRHRLCPRNDIQNILNAELDKIGSWLECNKLILNVNKTKLMVFHNRQFNLDSRLVPKLRIGGVEIERIYEFKFLGIWINEYLTWGTHIKYLKPKISRIIGVIQKIKSYVPVKCLKFIYLALIHSILNYGILLWGFDAKKLFVLQKKAMRAMTKSYYLAHTNPLFKKENILKIEDIFAQHCYKFYFNFINNQLPPKLMSLFTIPANNQNSCRLELFECNDAYGKNRLRYHLPLFINNASACIANKATTHSITRSMLKK